MFQNHKGLHCVLPKGTCQRLQAASLPAIDSSCTIGSARSYGPSGRTTHSSPDALRSIFLSALLSKQAAFKSLSKWAGVTHANEENVRPDAKTYPSPLREYLNITPQYSWIPRNFTEVESPWTFVRFIFYPLKSFTIKSRVVAIFGSLGPVSIIS